MSDLSPYLWLVPTLPLAASALTAFLGPRLLRNQSHWPCVLAVIGSFVVSLMVLSAVVRAKSAEHGGEPTRAAEAGEAAAHPHAASPQEVVAYYPWIQVEEPISTLAAVTKGAAPQTVALSSTKGVSPGSRLTFSPGSPPHEEAVEVRAVSEGGVSAVFAKDHPAGSAVRGALAVDAGFTLRADALTAMMIVMITFVGGLITIYSVGYMHGDEGYARFFAEIALFIFMMTTLVMADNFLLLYLGWEGVGLCSYLLIGFWFTKPAAAAAARKAFLVTRIGDMGFLLGILLVWYSFGHLDYKSIFEAVESQEREGVLNHHLMEAICLLLFCGAVGKSAQFPLHVWLPDAMEGPTPVSALIHAATMVTAGVYLVARCTPLFAITPEAQLVVACIGGFTALFAALIALTQNDLKRVLAYSTLSQLGYMFLALGSGVSRAAHSLVTFAVVAALFHLFTHAFFKALLFLASGSVMHAMGNVIDMRRFSGLRRVMPVTHWTFLCGALALAGFPLLSGFWSKDDVLAATYLASHEGSAFRTIYLILFVAGLVTAALTAFYTFRAYFMTFWGELRVPPEAGHHAHAEAGPHHHGPEDAGHHAHETAAAPQASYESPPVMTIPLVVLAVFAVGVGITLGDWGPAAVRFADFLELTPGFPETGPHEMHYGLMALSAAIALGGIAVAWWMYVKQPDLPGRLARSAQGLYQLSLNKFHVDELYDTFILGPLRGVTLFCRIFDQYVVDGLVDLIGHIPRLFGVLLRPVQNGLVQFYALAMVLSLTVFILMLVRFL
jgi:NADH-quinone oxidoreductase subunit L